MWCDSGEQQLIALPFPTPVSGFENLQLSDVSIDICLHLLNGLPLQFDDDDYFFFTFGYPLISMEDETLALPVSFLSFWYWHNKFWFYQYVDIKILWLSILHNQIICLYYDYIILYFIFSWKLITSSSFSLPLLYSCF